MSKRKPAARLALGLFALFVLIQFVPYGHSHANPRVMRAVHWDSAETAKLFDGACQDCHSNLSTWRWYDDIAPGSWLVERDIKSGRKRMNVSEWDRPQPGVGEVVAQITSGEMPPWQYKLLHAGGRLSQAQRDALARGIEATYRQDPPAAEH
jgi:mono/diheme cytochrome c family protein